MGMGLKFIARREIQVISTGEIEIQDEDGRFIPVISHDQKGLSNE